MIPSGSGFNFSIWIAGPGATQAPPIEKMERLIGAGIPGAQYTTWGGSGTVDCLTYPPQKATKGSAVQIDMYHPERTWQSSTPERRVTAGTNPFKLSGLKAGTTYYYRLFITHDQGKSWDYQSGSFKTD
jgi:hypothetical protein